MHQLEKIATTKAVKESEYKLLSSDLAPGIYLVECDIRLQGTITKGKPFKTTVPAAINPYKLLAKALSKLNSATIDKIVEEALAGTDDEAEAVKATVDEALGRLVAATERESSGRITAAMVWGLLG